MIDPQAMTASDALQLARAAGGWEELRVKAPQLYRVVILGADHACIETTGGVQSLAAAELLCRQTVQSHAAQEDAYGYVTGDSGSPLAGLILTNFRLHQGAAIRV